MLPWLMDLLWVRKLTCESSEGRGTSSFDCGVRHPARNLEVFSASRRSSMAASEYFRSPFRILATTTIFVMVCTNDLVLTITVAMSSEPSSSPFSPNLIFCVASSTVGSILSNPASVFRNLTLFSRSPYSRALAFSCLKRLSKGERRKEEVYFVFVF